MRKIGVEEELLLVDPETGELRQPLRPRAARPPGLGQTDGGPATRRPRGRAAPAHGGDAHRPLRRPPRRSPRRSARPGGRPSGPREPPGVAVAALGIAPLASERPRVTRNPRYERIVQEFGDTGLAAGTLGTHVHVDVADDEEGGAGPRRPAAVAAAAGRPRGQLAVRLGRGHRLRELAPAGVGPVAGDRAGRAVRLRRGVPAGQRGAHRHGCGPRPRDALLRRPAVDRLPDGRDPGRGRVHRRRRRRPARGARARPGGDGGGPGSTRTRCAPTCCARRTGGRRATACPVAGPPAHLGAGPGRRRGRVRSSTTSRTRSGRGR